MTTSYLPVLLDRIEDAPGKIGTVMLVNAAAGLLVPLAVGVWSDRRVAGGGSRRLPFVLGGSLVASGGLAAVALGFSSSYLVLAAFGAVVYVGLNAATTAHRALVPESFATESRPRATSAQEIALLTGGLLGIVVGGGLTGIAPWAPFAVAAVAVPVLALPTVSRTRESASVAASESASRPLAYYLTILRRPGVFGFLFAQVLWVLGYAALPAFFLLYAENVLGLEAAAASLFLAGFGLATGAAVLAAGRVRNQARLRPLLLLGIVLMGGGFLLVALVADLLLVGAALALVAVGFGLISTVGFPLFSSLIPEGEAGGHTALFFSVRAISSTIALPTAGWLIAATGSYRSLFVLGGLATLAALIPLSGKKAPATFETARTRIPTATWFAVWSGGVALLGLLTFASARLIGATPLHRLDEELFQLVNGLGPGPEVAWTLLDPHTRNYIVLVALAGTIALFTRPPRVLSVLALMLGSAVLSWGLLEAVYALHDRPRPEEVFDPSAISLNGHSWARLESFPSGHMAITTALAVAPRLRLPQAPPFRLGLRSRSRLHTGHVRRSLPARHPRRCRAWLRKRTCRPSALPAGQPSFARHASRLAGGTRTRIRRRTDASLPRRAFSGARGRNAAPHRLTPHRRRWLSRRERPAGSSVFRGGLECSSYACRSTTAREPRSAPVSPSSSREGRPPKEWSSSTPTDSTHLPRSLPCLRPRPTVSSSSVIALTTSNPCQSTGER